MRGRSRLRLVATTALALSATGVAGARGDGEGACSERCPIVAASLDLRFDPGHSGSSLRYEVVRRDRGAREAADGDGGDEVRIVRSGPRVDPHTGLQIPIDTAVVQTEIVERGPTEVEEFLAGLAEREACALGSPGSVIGLHPTFHRLEVRDACGNRRRVEWVSEGKIDPGKPYRRLRRWFEEFFAPRG